MKPQLLKRALPLLLTLCICGTLCAQGAHQVENVARIRLVDASIIRIIANASVEVHSNNGVICKRAPCLNNSQSWKGASDAEGVLNIPSHIIQYSVTLTTVGYRAAHFTEAAVKTVPGELRVLVSPSATAPQTATEEVAAAPSLPAVKGAWLVRLDIRYGRAGTKSNSWVMTSGGDIAEDKSWREETFPCRAKLSAENLRRIKSVVVAVNPSTWRLQYGRFVYDSGYRRLTLESREADGAVHTYDVTLRHEPEGQPEDFQALHAEAQAVVAIQVFADQSCSPDPAAMKYGAPQVVK
ncbi:MAG: hypothetical protein H0V27_01435 [Pyrinomonadaceae bacterium]|jgi:hypothetical protein|nr:hypothetical protein [Pyrinomonadaceae bacterium]